MSKKNRAQSKHPGPPFAWEPPRSALPLLADAQSVFDQALALHRAGRLAEAEQLYRQVLEVHPQSFDCLHLLGVVSYQRGDCAAALRQIDAALKINPGVADAHLNRGNALKKLKRFEEALASYDKAAALRPRDPSILNSRGAVLRELKRFDDALTDFDAAIALRPDFAEAFGNRGNVFKDLERFDAALADYAQALALKPGDADAFNNRGNLYKELEQYDEALENYDKAVALNPRYAEAFYNRGTTLFELRRLNAALMDLNQAVALKPDYAEAIYNRGTTLMEFNRIDDALADLDKAIAFKPDYPDALWNRGLCNLLAGRYREGWPDYERRWQTSQEMSQWWNSGRPLWTGGADVAGKTLLLHSEQGFGDTVMAARYVRRVIDMGARVVLEAPPALAGILAQIEGAEVVTAGQAVPDFDLHCPLMSLPRAFGTTVDTIPAGVPYLSAPAAHLEKWRQRLPTTGALRVGINWGGNPDFKRDAIRSIGLRRMLPMLVRTDVQLFSLQRDLRDGDEEILQNFLPITLLGDEIDSFADTAAIVSLLDLVISADTSVVHLAGALGRPVWVLLSFAPDWRWLLGRDDSPWYPTARLFRQAAIDDWSSPVEQAAAELAALVARQRADQASRSDQP